MEKITCRICGFASHILIQHLADKHKLTPQQYIDKHDGPLWSSYGLSKIREVAPSAKVRSTPRPRKLVSARELFPEFGVAEDLEISGEYPIFQTAGPLTPQADPHYVFPEEQTLTFLSIIDKPVRNRVYLKGYSGTGKTQLVFNLAARVNAEVMEWNADSYQQRADLIGRWTVKDGATVWQNGILPTAMINGYWLVINEIDTIDPHTLNMMKPVLEDPPRLTILENGGEVVHAHPDFRIIATANTWGRGDSTGLFVNTNTQSDADARRWSARIRLDYMDTDTEIRMLQGYFPKVPVDVLTKFVQVAERIRESFVKGTIDKTFSPAELINWIDNWLTLGTERDSSVLIAARYSFIEAVDAAVAEAITEYINARFGHGARS